jgi:uncharacterized protein (TIGR03086 family)
MGTQVLEQAIGSTRSVLATVKKDQLSSSTACASWKVSELINHIVGGQLFFAAMVNGDEIGNAPPDFSAGDFLATFDQASKEAVAAFSADGAMSKICHLPFGDMPASVFVNIAATDTFTHGWDLARATGQSTDLAPGLAEGLLAGAKAMIPESFRGPEGKSPFAAEQTAPAGASNADQLAAFLGRTV